MTPATAIEYEPTRDPSPAAREDIGTALKLVVPSSDSPPRVGLVPRPRLVAALRELGGPRVAVLVAPAGYGKTTLLEEWSRRDERPFAWVALDERDNDPRRLLASTRRAVAGALGRDRASAPFVLVLDDAHVVHQGAAIAALATIVRDLPPQAMLAISSRARLQLPIARMRAQRDVTELGPRELAMTRTEAGALLKADRHDLEAEGVDTLVARTEGWPAALSLASLFLAERGVAALGRFGGADRLVRDYVRDEVLAGLPADRLDFMLRICVVDILTAPLCDALAGRDGSAAELAALAREGLVVPLDRSDERFRHHRLLADALRSELRSTAPEREPELHRAASAWHRRTGDVERAVDHALRAGEVAEAGALVWQNLAPLVAEGRTSTTERWLGRFTASQIAEHATLALTAAGCALLRGRGDLAAHWAAAAATADGHDPTIRAGVAILSSALGDAALGTLREAAEEQPGEGAGGALCLLVEGMARHLDDDHDRAAAALEAGARRAAVSAPAIHALCLAELAVLALDQDDWELAAALVTRARAQVDRHGLADHAPMALVFAVSALVRAHRGRVDSAQSDLLEAARLQTQFTDFPPGAEAEIGLLLARAALRLGDVTAGRTQLTMACRLVRRLPDAILLHRWVAVVGAQLDAFTAADGPTHASMTAAELRILQYLPTHLSFREIGELTYVSANTVKTQANAIYRKLCVSSRSDAVTRARSCGLLDCA